MTEIKYILLPQWKFKTEGHFDFDIPPYFIKIFSHKKEIEDYLNSNDVRGELMKIKDNEIAERVDRYNPTGEERTKALARMFAYHDITFWVIGVNPQGKENRIGIMQQEHDKNSNSLKWKYRSYFGGKVWKHQLLFGIYG